MQMAMSRIELPKYQCQLFNLYYIETATAANFRFPPIGLVNTNGPALPIEVYSCRVAAFPKAAILTIPSKTYAPTFCQIPDQKVKLHPEDCLLDGLALEIQRPFRGCFCLSVAQKGDTAIVGEMVRAS
ncbi:hypothetical protein [Celeribacter baekdonensis]|uniref:hypothetical protein n=1 Tax=Celeribacter baekdonensis TaxID=875171 RepID=UPI0030DC0F9A|tara:strand:+ start:36054 stop:36437 length:384 start_codon:yes stop_codon:yes gene_type:complete